MAAVRYIADGRVLSVERQFRPQGSQPIAARCHRSTLEVAASPIRITLPVCSLDGRKSSSHHSALTDHGLGASLRGQLFV